MRNRNFCLVGLLLAGVVGLAWWINSHNVYMTEREYTVTFIEKSAPTRCHKSTCRADHRGLFKTDEGLFFEESIGLYTYTQMHLGERYVIKRRPFDINQNPIDNWKWFFGASMFFFVSVGVFIMWVVVGIVLLCERFFGTPNKDS